MTKEQFDAIRWNRDVIVKDNIGHQGHVTCVDFRFGVVHYLDDQKGSGYGRDYKDLEIVNV